MLQEPDFVEAQARQGVMLPTYAYAANNPLRYSDPTGLCFWDACVGEAWVGYAIFAAVAATMATQAVVAASSSSSKTSDTPQTKANDCAPVATGPTVVPRIIGPVTVEDHCNTMASEFVGRCRRECERRTALWEECKEACRKEGRGVYEACMKMYGR